MRWLAASSERVRWWRGWGGALVLSAALLPSVAVAQEPAEGRTHTVKRGDTLWDIAAAYLGDPFQWPEIYRVNRDVVENPHWIYPGETLRIPGGDAPAVAEPPEPQPASSTAGSTVFAPPTPAAPTRVGETGTDARPAVRPGQILAAPYVIDFDGPRDAGRVIDSRDLPGIHVESQRGRYRQYEEVSLVLPGDATGTVGERYVALARDESLEGLGQLVRPTAIVELRRPAGDGQAAVGRVVSMFGDFRAEHRLVVLRGLDAPSGSSTPVPAGTGQEARIRTVVNRHVLPTIGAYFVIDASSRQGVRVGDELLIYEPSREGTAGRPDEPEVVIGRAQVVRVTSHAATAVVLSIRQPRIERGKWVRVVSRMP